MLVCHAPRRHHRRSIFLCCMWSLGENPILEKSRWHLCMSFPSERCCFGHHHSLCAQAVRVILVDPVRLLPPSLLCCWSSREICTVPMCAPYPFSQWYVLLFLFGSSFLAEALQPSFGFRGGYLLVYRC